MWYTLDEYLNIREATIDEWGEFFGNIEKKRIAYTQVSPTIRVSTVFLGLDHSSKEDGALVLFESLVFNGKHDGEMLRYTSYDDAVKGHNELVTMCLKTHRRRDPLEHYVRKKLARQLEYYKEDTKSILKRRMRKVIKR